MKTLNFTQRVIFAHESKVKIKIFKKVKNKMKKSNTSNKIDKKEFMKFTSHEV